MVYNSWLAMQQAGETDEETCAYNDLALVKLDPADVGEGRTRRSRTSAGPTGVGRPRAGKHVYTYGNSELRAGITLLSPKNGLVVSKSAGGWSYTVYTVTPGHPGRLRLRVPQRERPGPRRR